MVLKWFFGEYLSAEFDAPPIVFTPSSSGATFLEWDRHLFSEMEGVLAQFALFVEDGSIDRDLHGMGSEQVDYRKLPSLIEKKYAYLVPASDLTWIVHHLYSDQSNIKYVNEDLQDLDAARLISRRAIPYESFQEYQKPIIDRLIEQGILANEGTRVRRQVPSYGRILRELHTTDAVSYGHASDEQRSLIDDMVDKGWLTTSSTLLTKSEASYFNYMLNQKEFGNGPDLRNKYLHASISYPDEEGEHFATYIVALKLLIVLAIKINDDYYLRYGDGKTGVVVD